MRQLRDDEVVPALVQMVDVSESMASIPVPDGQRPTAERIARYILTPKGRSELTAAIRSAGARWSPSERLGLSSGGTFLQIFPE